ncbi:ATP-binding protein [Peribacillus sp. V2I11]|uniref:ATP-binding protein n=1 Tax=Peribacillus sp. V2I11 TaxID=3042277 RepID=UPI00278124BC|nr:ATP-binding protein [Peribacillus sp. V2I11]MDQ0884910.1 putative ATP-binding protein involved in virulence [Peribacillus sp. V2I11]
MQTFLTKIQYKNNPITLSTVERKHLIITGKNGSGKTSMLQAIKKQLILIERYSNERFEKKKDSNEFLNPNYTDFSNLILNEQIVDYSNINTSNIDNGVYLSSLSDLEKTKFLLNEIYNSNFGKEVLFSNKQKKYVSLEFNALQDEKYVSKILQNGFIVAYFDSKRAFSFEKPQGITVTSLSRYSIKDQASSKFVQYLVNLKADRAFAFEEGNITKVESIDKWFRTFEVNLQELFETEKLELHFDRKTLSFNVKFEGKSMNLLYLSDGFSSVIYIISEIIMRMKNKRRHQEEGIVIIDEIETHLHVSLQKKVLRFLTNFFPNIQFIVSTHSPFVLSSIDNAIVYDLETKEQLIDMSSYSYESIVEDYFNIDQYSYIIKNRFETYLKMVNKEDSLNPRDLEELNKLRRYFNNISDSIAPEIKSKFYHLELMRKSEKK